MKAIEKSILFGEQHPLRDYVICMGQSDASKGVMFVFYSVLIGLLIDRDSRLEELELTEGDTTFWYDEVTHQCVSLEITDGIYEEIINGEYIDFENMPEQVIGQLTLEVKASGYSIDDYSGAVYIDNGNNEGHYYLVW